MSGVEMDAQTLQQLRERLETELARLESERALILDSTGEDAYRDHMADQGSATFEREFEMNIEENLTTALAEVRTALDRIDSGVYGQCRYCQEEIPSERLEAVPTATLCIACKSADEHR